MKFKKKNIIQFSILLLIGIGLTWLSLHSVWGQRDKIINSFSSVNYFWIIISTLIGIFSHVLRAYRWNYLLAPLNYNINLNNAVGFVFIGYFANYGLPRMGEITRCTLAKKYNNVPFETALGTVITERIIDTIILMLIFLLTIVFQFQQLKALLLKYILIPFINKFKNDSVSFIQITISILILMAIAIVFYFIIKKLKNSAIKTKLQSVLKGFVDGLKSVKNLKQPLQFILLSISIWAAYFYSLYVCFFAFEHMASLGQSECLTLLLFGTFGVVFSPGGLGAYPAIISGLLIYTYNIDTITSVSFPWLTWSVQFISIVIIGLFYIILLPLINKKKHELS